MYSLNDFRDTNEQTLNLLADKYDLDISQNKAYQHTKNTLLGQMFCFQQGVKLVEETKSIEEEAKTEEDTRNRNGTAEQHQRGIIGQIPQSHAW